MPMDEERGTILAQWTFPEYERHERGRLWYLIALGIDALLLIYAVKDGNFLFALIIILFTLIIFTHHRSEPIELPFVIYSSGIQIGDRFYLYREINAFAVIYEPPVVKRLYIKPKGNVIRNELSIPLQKQNPIKIRSILLDYLDEDLDHDRESPNDMAMRIFKL
jgi:hypothetical protein